MLKKILAVIVVLIAAFAGYVAMQPDELLIQRQATIAAPADQVFAQVNDLHKWDAWSPWAKIDPNVKVGFEGRPRARTRHSPGPATTRSAKAA
ncbi:MAG: hypothetical protein M5U16_13015 [Hyphomicrobium sp.]|nr:hypothetical protein [Hyphomicrobium sp.]